MLARLLSTLLFLALMLGGARAGVTDAGQDEVRDRIARQLGPGSSYALVIGIADYDGAWPALPGVTGEVTEISGALQAQGFTIVSSPAAGHVTVAELRRSISDFVRAYGGEAQNRLVIYIASHGAAAGRDGAAIGYLVASDTLARADRGFAASAYSVNELSDALLGIASQHVYLFFNACFSGAMVPNATRGTEAPPSVTRPVAAPLSPAVADWTLELLSHNARLVLTAGSDGQEVPDRNNPFAKAILRGLNGAADADGDGLILGTELAQFVRGFVARESRALNTANDPVFAILPKMTPPPVARPDAPKGTIDYRLQGDFVFLSPLGAHELAGDANVTARRNDALPGGQFTDCPDCPVMVEIPGQRYALARTETTLAEWDACYRELGCRRWLADGGQGRGDWPAQGVDWADSLEFVQWLNRKPSAHCQAYRLPTEAEWTRAALAGSATPLPWGDTMLPGKAVCWGCGEGMSGWSPERAASHPANAFGLFDMIGNLWEWTDSADSTCRLADLLASGTCTKPGTVIGGSYATRAITGIATGDLPRSVGVASPTVGLRAACDLR